jgi:hypothetical protein
MPELLNLHHVFNGAGRLAYFTVSIDCTSSWSNEMAKVFPIHPKHPERICWGCDKYCPADSMACGNGSDRTQHPVELFGEDWMEWGLDSDKETATSSEK